MGDVQTSNNKSMFVSFAKVIQNLCRKIENLPKGVLEIIASIIYLVAHVIIGIFHEPWYDEAVAWQIARSASIKDILFEIPHYEGHPQLWHIILFPFAKLGAPYELSLVLVSLIFAGAACCLIIWKAPFPRIVRILLPFTYFFFYQYGVISRPYCVMMLAFVLLAMSYKNKDEKPGLYVASLMLLCMASAYGILIAGGLAIAWILEMWNYQNIIDFIKKMLRDKRTLWLLILLVFALLLISFIMPRTETAAFGSLGTDIEGIIRALLYMFLALPSEVTMTTIFAENEFLKAANIPLSSLIITCILGMLIWFFILKLGKHKKTLLVLIIPYSMYATFAAVVYAWNHHIGVGLLIFVFWMWITLNKDSENDLGEIKELKSAIMVLLGTLAMIISLMWNITSCVQEVIYNYSIGRNEAQFIKENGLDNYNIMVGFDVAYEDGKLDYMNVNESTVADNIAPYFEHNIFFNFNNGEDSLNYSTHRIVSKEEEAEIIKNWQKQRPDILYMYPSIDLIYEGIDLHEYKLIYRGKSYKMWKGFFNREESKIYAHEDLIEELGLETLGAETFARMQHIINSKIS